MNPTGHLRLLIMYCIFIAGAFQSLFSYEYELVVVSQFHNCAPYIKEWVKYHHEAGADHFWLYDNGSTDNWQEVLQPYINQGFVEVFSWPTGNRHWTDVQMAAFRDGLKRGLGVAKWVTLLDQDEYLMPMHGSSITKCLQNHYHNESAIYVNWRHFGTSKITLIPGEPLIPRLTSCSEKTHSRNGTGKSILRPECALIERMWSQHHCPLRPGYNYVDGDGGHSLRAVGDDWHADGRHHDRYLRINHYAHRDEAYFWNTRLPRDRDKKTMLEHYNDFNKLHDARLINLIKNNFPNFYIDL